MPDQIYKYNGSGDYYGDPVVIKDSWPQPVKDMWVKALSSGYTLQAAPWVPTYETLVITWPGNDGSLQSFTQPNDPEFPTKDTCTHLASLYAATVTEIPFFGGGPSSSTAVKRLLLFSNGKSIEAWALANAYTNNPPDLADKICRNLIAELK